jgi:hypothetical protein
MTVYSGPGAVEYRGRVLRQAKSLRINFETNNKDVNTLADGRAGHTPGPKLVTVDVSSAIPAESAGGLEVDFVAISQAQQEVEFTYVLAGTRYRVKGDLRSASMSSDAEGGANEVSYQHVGTLQGTT